MIEQFEQFFNSIDPMTAYWILFLSAFVENTFPPIPGDTVTVIGAYLITAGVLSFWGVYISTTIGSVLGFFTMYLIGIRLGPSFFKTGRRAKIFSEKNTEKVKRWFANYGYWVVLANRFLSGTRSVISLFAGFVHLKWLPLLLLSTISAFLWNGLLIYGGYLLGANWKLIKNVIGQYNKIVFVLTLVLILAFVIRKYLSKSAKLKEKM
jgi:membrane protein DedA with SNARE-associated domain